MPLLVFGLSSLVVGAAVVVVAVRGDTGSGHEPQVVRLARGAGRVARVVFVSLREDLVALALVPLKFLAGLFRIIGGALLGAVWTTVGD